MSIAHSKWTANQLAYQQALQEGPTAALERLRTAFHDRASAPLSKREEVVELADILGFCLRESDENTELWRAMAKINIISLLVDVMAEPDFLMHYLRFSSSVCGLTIDYLETSLSAVHQGRRKVAALTFSDTLWSKIDRAWASLWANRQHLANNSDRELKLALLDQLEHLASTIRAFEMAVPLKRRSSQDLARVAYFAWVQLYGNERITERDVISLRYGHQAQSILWQYLDNCPDDQTRRATMTRIIEDVGVDRSFRATENALKWSLWMVVPQLFTCVKLFTLHTTLFLSSALSANRAGLSAVAEAMRQQGRRIEHAKIQGRVRIADEWLSMRMLAAGAILEYVEVVVTAVHNTGNIHATALSTTSIDRVWAILMLVLGLVYEAGGERIKRDDIKALALENTLMQLVTLLAQVTDSMVIALTTGGLASSIVNGFRASAIIHSDSAGGPQGWYVPIQNLRWFSTRQSPASHIFTDVVGAWMRLGRALGLDEVVERDEFASYNARMCSWEACSFHVTPSPKPLLICKGCHESRYCSKECQTRDWKQGGHREECRRLKG